MDRLVISAGIKKSWKCLTESKRRRSISSRHLTIGKRVLSQSSRIWNHSRQEQQQHNSTLLAEPYCGVSDLVSWCRLPQCPIHRTSRGIRLHTRSGSG